MKAEDLEGNVAKNYPTPSCQTFDIHIGEWRLEDELGSRLRSRSEDRISIPRILTNSTNNVSFFLTPLIILPIASIIVHHPTLHPFLIFNHFSSPFEKEKETRQTENFPPRHCSHDAPREERIVKIKKKREKRK